MKAIETTYQGVRFRSRLEARWAVFFDAMGIAWQYEPQGFELRSRLNGMWNGIEEPEVFHYLPDFHLPELDLWAEAKGTLTTEEARRLLECSAALSSQESSGCSGPDNDVVVLGPFDSTKAGKPWFPTLLHFHKGILFAQPWFGGRGGCGSSGDALDIASDCGDYWLYPRDGRAVAKTIDVLLGGWTVSRRWASERQAYEAVAPGRRWDEALRAARSARFEYGNSGALR